VEKSISPSRIADPNPLVHRGTSFRIAPDMQGPGGNVQNTKDFDRNVQLLLDMIGGEPLAESGFEQEDPEPDFCSNEEE
jgi:hypothetical protein